MLFEQFYLGGLSRAVAAFESDKANHGKDDAGRRHPAVGESNEAVRKSRGWLGLALTQQEIDAVDELCAGERFGYVVVGAELVPPEHILVLDLGG